MLVSPHYLPLLHFLDLTYYPEAFAAVYAFVVGYGKVGCVYLSAWFGNVFAAFGA